ncbi:serine hydrolase domain-containing protein [Salinimicrobium sp. HB62]|uniref:serine hydrolase domain-containing protein n=1 Tax=Salinimicrobium sp. HB62 TaxID=3077781 RepID=UPI002D76EA8F|nr:serine hydrolase domain-containing protein [Salinimicrobium sp. HB62]
MIKKLLVCSALLLFFNFGFSQSTQPDEPFLLASEDIFEKIDLLGNRYLELGRFSGSILVEDGSTYYYNNFGKANYELDKGFDNTTAFKVGSLTELFTRAVFAELVRKEKISADRMVSHYLPEVKKELTLRQLIDHRSELQTIEEIKQAHPEAEYSAVSYANLSKVAEFQKSDLNYNLLKNVLEVASDRTYAELISELAEKIQLKNTFFDTPVSTELAQGYTYSYEGNEVVVQPSEEYDTSETFSSKSVKTTAADLLKLLKVFPEEELSMEGYLKSDGFSYSVIKNGKRMIIVLSNRRHPVTGEITEAVNALLDTGKCKLPLLRKEIKVDSRIIGEYAGSYALNPDMHLGVMVENDSLFVQMGPQKVHLKAQSPNQFYMEQRDSAIRFLRGPSGEVIAAELLDGFLTGKKIEKVNF